VDVVLVDVVPEAVVIEVTAIEDLILLEVPEMCQSMNCSSSQDLKSSVFQLRIPHRSDLKAEVCWVSGDYLLFRNRLQQLPEMEFLFLSLQNSSSFLPESVAV